MEIYKSSFKIMLENCVYKNFGTVAYYKTNQSESICSGLLFTVN